MSYYTKHDGVNSDTKQPMSEKKAQEALKAVFDRLKRDYFAPAFEQARTYHRIMGVLEGMLIQGDGRRTITNSRVVRGLEQKDWNADYRGFSIGKWEQVELYHGVFKGSVPLLSHDGPVLLGIDDTGMPKAGYEIQNVGWIHNPLQPKWIRPAIMWGVPMMHAALLIPADRVHRPTAVTVAFEPIHREKKPKDWTPKPKPEPNPAADGSPVPPPRKRGRPSNEEVAKRQAAKEEADRELAAKIEAGEAPPINVKAEIKVIATEHAVQIIKRVRQWLDEAGMESRLLMVVGDGSFTNQTVMLNLPHNTEYVGRTRPDTRLQNLGEKTKAGKVKVGKEPFPTPAQIVEGNLLPVLTGNFQYAGSLRPLEYRSAGPVFRKSSTGTKMLRLMILEPVPFGKGENAGYNERAYLLTTDMTLPPTDLVQFYLYRWELENIHRILKTTFGVGDAQVRHQRVASAMAAYFALMQVAIRLSQGEERHAGYGPLPKWIANRRASFTKLRLKDGKPAPVYRASATDIKTLFRKILAPKGTKVTALVA